MKRRYHAALCLPAMTFSYAASAQQTPVQAEMQQVVIKGPGETELRRNDTAGRLIVGRNDLERFGDSNLSDVLKRQPGVSVNGSEIRMRGLGAGYTQILINGDPAPGSFTIDSISPDLIERIEILRTAMADTSAQSVAGSINIILRKPRGENTRRTGKFSVERLQHRYNPAASLQWSGRLDKMSYSVSASLSRSQVHNDPYVDVRSVDLDGVSLRRFDQPEDMDVRRASLTPRVELTLGNGDVLSWQGLFNIQSWRAAGTSSETTLIGEPTDFPESNWKNAFRTSLAKSDLGWSHRFEGARKLTLKAGVEINDRDGDYLFRGINPAGVPRLDRAVDSGFNERRGTTSGKYLTPLFTNHDMAFGWDAAVTRRRESRLQQDSEPQSAPYYKLDQDYTGTVGRLALYAQDEWSLTERLQVYLGMRWEGLNTRTTGRDFAGDSTQSRVWSPVAQMLWKLPNRERDQVRASLSRTYKTPEPRDLVPRRYTTNNDNGPTNPDVQGNPLLRPELAWGLDLAYESYFGREGVASISAYGRRIRDVMLQELSVDNGKWISTPVNGGGARVYGIELDTKIPVAAFRPDWPTMDLRANVGRNWSRVDDLPGPDNRLAAQAPLSANLGADLRFKSSITAGINLHVVRGNVARLTPALTTVTGIRREIDTYIAWNAWRGQWRLSASDLLHQTRLNGQVYNDGTGVNERMTFTPRQAVVRLQYEASL